MLNPEGIRSVDVLYRVSTRAQEAEGESLYNQRREVEEKWADPAGIKVRRRIEVAESGKGALRLVGGGFQFNRRAEYTQLIVEYQAMKPAQRPDAIAIDWADRWSRNVLEYSGLVTAFRVLGIRLLAIGDGLDLTDPRNDLVTHVKAAIGQEQLRITKEKVSEARRSRRERGKWQGGTCPDGYRTHSVDCAGLIEVPHETLDGKTHLVKIRACQCDRTALIRDPARCEAIAFIWKLLETSPRSWAAMSDEVNERGFRRPNGTPFRWHDLYRIGQNPHYAGGMATNRWEREGHDGSIKKWRPLADQSIDWSTDAIPHPYVSRETFESVYKHRFNKLTRYLPRARNGSVSELTGILRCPDCKRPMSSFTTLSPMVTGHGNPRRSPRRKWINMQCSHANQYHPTCANKKRVRVETISLLLIEQLAETVTMSDSAILAALKLKQSETSMRVLESERRRLLKAIETANNARHTLTQLLAAGALTQSEVEADLFEHRRDRVSAETRLREIQQELSRQHAKPDFEKARTTLGWLSEQWRLLTVTEKAEAFRLLVERVTYTPNGTVYPTYIRIEQYGRAFIDPAASTSLGSAKEHA